ncbi:hypothetical protein [Roseiflexus sp.]|uniref:hypothetical protein n=1 Tax=Roseiflexus sp. TaxID=2562120 RepID=UPI00398AFC0C
MSSRYHVVSFFNPAGVKRNNPLPIRRCSFDTCHATTIEFRVGTDIAGVLQPEGPIYPLGADDGGTLPNGVPRTASHTAAFIRTTDQGQIGIMWGAP